jgi:hypothetical protein
MLGIKPWEVLEVALAKYFERSYGMESRSLAETEIVDS